MSNTEDNSPIDNELKAYLAGEDGVSSAYRQASAEEPPAELDRVILAAAHKAINREVKQDAPRKLAGLQHKFSIAASFMVGVLITSMYFTQTNDRVENAPTVGVARERQSVEQPAPASAPAAPAVSVDQESAAPEPLERLAAQQAEQRTLQAESSPVVATRETPEPAANKTTAAEESILADNAMETADTAGADATAQPSARQLATAANIAPPPVRANFNETRAESAAAGVELEEIMVTGSRIRREEDRDISYRENQQAWLEQILALGENIILQTNVLGESNSALEEEIELFTEAYPDVDLEAELQSLGTE